MRENMTTIGMKMIPDNIPVSSEDGMHYCDVTFLLYRVETEDEETGVGETCADVGALKKGPSIVVTAKAAPSGSRQSSDALCMASDIPAAGYSFQKPDNWGCSDSYNSLTGEVSFTFTAPVNGGKDFTAVQIKINSYYTTAQAGACVLNVKLQNIEKFDPAMTNRSFSVPLCKKYDLEILRFSANHLTGEFFLNHKLPVEFFWDVVCDNDTPLELMEDDIQIAAVQEFSGEYLLPKRKANSHTYTLKMTLPGGEKTKSIRIDDTRWRSISAPTGLILDDTRWNTMLSWCDGLCVFYNNTLYQSKLDGEYAWSDWKEALTYQGEVLYEPVTAQVICGDRLYLIGGRKDGTDDIFYSVYDMVRKNGWKDYSAGLEASFAGGTATCGGGENPWFIYAKQIQDYLFLEQYDENDRMFNGFYQICMEGMTGFDIYIKKDVLYIALRSEGQVSLMTLDREKMEAENIGIIDESVRWLKWIQGKSNMYLLSDTGLYREGNWENVEEFNPFRGEEQYPWIGADRKRIVGLMSSKEGAAAHAWATDTI